ncbi:MAG: ArsR/SmtB family transcription factor [Brevibacterium sp.]
MAKYSDQLDAMFTALADPTRRTVVTRLGRGPASVGELAQPLSISLPSFMKHVRTLEACGLIRTRKTGRVRTCVLNQDRLRLLDGWLEEQRRIWEAGTDRLEQFVTGGQQPVEDTTDTDGAVDPTGSTRIAHTEEES